MLVIDYFSKYIEVAQLYSGSTAKNVITQLKSLFSRHGIPKILISESQDFKNFKNEWEITHITASPYHSHSNGLAERGIGIVENILRKCELDNSDPYMLCFQVLQSTVSDEILKQNFLFR